MLRSAFSIIVTLLLVVGVHEAGHALAARLLSVKIERIAIGFGRPLFLWKTKKGLELVWGILPLGGYVQLLDSRRAAVEEKDLPHCFDKQPFWKRLSILLAGGLANAVLAIVAMTLFFMIGFRFVAPVVHGVLPNSIMAEAGLKANDKIIAIANQPCITWKDATRALLQSLGKKNVSLLVENEALKPRVLLLDLSKKISIKANSFYSALGIQLNSKKHKLLKMAGKPLVPAFNDAIHNTWQWLTFYLIMVKQIVTGVIPFSLLLGPISIFFITIQSFTEGIATFLYYIASFSLAVGLVNLFPIPGLDGGAIIFALIEKIRGKAMSNALEILVYRLAMIAFFMFLMHLIMNDVQRYFLNINPPGSAS